MIIQIDQLLHHVWISIRFYNLIAVKILIELKNPLSGQEIYIFVN